MVSKNNKHGKPKKKYKKRRTSFRNNKKNINLRSNSLKRKKGGAIGDNAADFGLPSDTSVNLSTLKSLCDKYQYDVDSTEVNPRTMRTNYIIPNAKKWYTGNNVKNAAAFEKARLQRVACYTYYKKAFSFGFFKKIFTSQQKKLADPIYGSYDKLLTEDSIDNQDIKDAKDKYLMACAIANAYKHRVGITLLRYIRSSKSDAISQINRQYKSYLNQLKKLANKKKRNATGNDKKIYETKIASYDKLLKSDNPLDDEFKVKKTKEFVKKLDALKTKQSDDKSDNTFVFISFYNHMTNAIGALTLLNTTLLLNGYDDTIVEPPQWFSRKIGNVTIDDTFKNMLEPDEQDNLEKYLFGVDAPTSENALIRSISSNQSSQSSLPITESEINTNQDDDVASVTSFLVDDSGLSEEEGTEMQEIVSSAVTNINDNPDEFRTYSADSDPDSERRLSVVESTSNVTVPKANKSNIRELDQIVLEAMSNSTPFTKSSRKSDNTTSKSTTDTDSDSDESDDEPDDDESTTTKTSSPSPPVELSDMGTKPPELTVSGKSNIKYPTNILIKKLFLDFVRDEASEVVLDKQEKNWYGKNIMYKSCNVKDANRLLEKINDIPSTKTLLIQDKQNISNNETPLYTTIQKDNTIDVDKRLQDCGGIIDPLQDNVDNKQEGLIMSIPQLAWVWRNVAKKDKKLQDEAVCYYKTFIGYCKMNDIELSSKDQCNIPADWDPDNNNICQDTVDANKAVQDAMDRASQQESDFNKQVAQEQAASTTYQANLKDYQDRKAKHDAAKNKPPTSDEVYAYINEASTGKNPGPVPGVEAPGPEPTDPNELDSTSTLVPVDENPDSKELDSTSTLVPLNSQALPVAIDSGSVPYEVPLIDPNNIESVTVDSTEEATNKTVKEWIALANREGFFTGALKDDFEAFPSEEGESEEAKKIRFAKRQLNQYFAPPSSSSCSVPKPKTYKVNNRQVPEGYSYNKSRGDGNCLYYSVLSASHAKKCSPGNDPEFKTLIGQNNLKEAMTILRVKLLQFMDSDEYKRCPNYATANKDSSEALVLNNYISMKSSIGTLDNWAGDEVLGLIECMCNITIRVFYQDCWGRNNQGDDSDPNLINLYFTGSHYDWLSKNDQATSGGKSNNPIVEATLTAMSQFGGGEGKKHDDDDDDLPENQPSAPSSDDLGIFSKCTAKKCKNFYSLCRTREEFQKYWHNFGGLSDEEISRLGGLEEDNQEGLVVTLPQLDKVYNNTALTSTKSDKACLRCLYMGFINLCKARGIALDPELQQDITKDYKPGDIEYSIESNNVTPAPSPDSNDDNSDDGNNDNSDDGDEDEDDILRSASGTSSISKKKVPRGPKNIDLPVAKPTGVNPPIQIITDSRKKDKYIWIKIKADPNCLSGIVDNTYDSAEATLNKLINIDDDEAVNFAQAVTPSAPPADSDGSGTTKPSTSRSNSDGSGTTKPSAPPADNDSGTTQSVSKPSSGFTSDEPASNLVSPDEDKSKSITGGCNDVPEETEERPPPASGKAKKGELFCPSQAPYLCGKKTISYQDRLKRGLGAACRVKEHDCNSRKLPVGDTDSAKKVYQSVNEEDGLSARFYVDPSKNPADITSCSKKTKGGSKKHKKSSKNRKKAKKLSLKIRT